MFDVAIEGAQVLADYDQWEQELNLSVGGSTLVLKANGEVFVNGTNIG